MAAVGAGLLLVAAVVVVAGHWQSIAPEIKFVGLFASLCAAYFAAEALRPTLPTTAAAFATLAAAMTAPAAISAASVLDQPWPVCVTVGGLSALIATELQTRRWHVAALQAASVVALGLAAVGVAALTATPIAVLGALGAAGLLVAGALKRSAALAIAVGVTVFLPGLAHNGVGPGVLERLGAVGSDAHWGTPLGIAIAAVVVAVAAVRLQVYGLTIAAAALSAVAVVVSHASDAWWWCLPATAALAVEMIAIVGRGTVWQRFAERARPTALFMLTALCPVLWVSAMSAALPDPNHAVSIVPFALTAVASWVATGQRIITSTGSVGIAVTTASIATAALAAAARSGTFGWLDVAAYASITVATMVIGHQRQPAWSVASGALVAVTAIAALHVAGATLIQAVLTLLALGAALTSLALFRPEQRVAESASVAVTWFALVAAADAPLPIVSIVLGVGGAQLALLAISHSSPFATAAASALSTLGMVSLWWTTGAHVLVIERLTRYGFDGVDAALALSVLSLSVGGIALRHAMRVSSWLAYGPGLAIACAWLIDAQLDGDGLWATIAALAIGISSVAIGGLRQLAGPLVIGSALTAATVIASAGIRLAAAPTWVWIAGGGSVLLGLAALTERSERPLLLGNDDHDSHVERFFRSFN